MSEKIGVCKINIALRKVRNGLFIFDFFLTVNMYKEF